jgi:hypothetical protein
MGGGIGLDGETLLSEHIQQTAQMNDRSLGSCEPPGLTASLFWDSIMK